MWKMSDINLFCKMMAIDINADEVPAAWNVIPSNLV